MLPDGTPFTFTVYTDGTPGRWAYQNAQAAYVEWKRFGFDVRFEVGDAGQLRIAMGQFDVAGTQTHGSNYLENPDLFRTFTAFDICLPGEGPDQAPVRPSFPLDQPPRG